MIQLLACVLAAGAGRVTDQQGKPRSDVIVTARPLIDASARCKPDECSCPGRREALLAGIEKALAARPARVPVGSAGDFEFPPGTFVEAVTRDGALRGWGTDPAQPIVLAPAEPLEIDATAAPGVDLSTAKLFVVDPLAGSAVRADRKGDKLVAQRPGPGWLSVVTAAKGMGVSVHSEFRYRASPFRAAPSTFSPQGPVEGTVVSEGKPVPNAEVIALPESCALKTKTDAAGHFRFDGLVLPPFLTELAAHAENLTGVALGGSEPVTMELWPPHVVAVQLVDGAGKPVGGVEVGLRLFPKNRTTSAVSDQGGRLTVEAGDSTRVEAAISRGEWTLARPASFDARADSVKLELTHAERIDVDVDDGSGHRVPAASLQIASGDVPPAGLDSASGLEGARWIMGDGGVTAIGGLAPGVYTLWMDDLSYGRARAVARAPGHATLMATTAAIEGVVRTPTGQPLARVSISAVRPGDTRSTASDAAGRFRLALAEGEWKVTARAIGSQANVEAHAVTMPGTGVVALPLTVQPAGKIRGSAVLKDGKPAAGANIAALPPGHPLCLAPDPRAGALIALMQRQQLAQLALGMPQAVAGAGGAFEVDGDDACVAATLGGLSAAVVAHAGHEVKLVLETPAAIPQPTPTVSLYGKNVCDAYVSGKGPAQRVTSKRMTGKWVVDELTVQWGCPLAGGGGKGELLEVAVADSPSKTVTVDLRPANLWGGTTSVQLYLWPVDDVKRACARPGELRLPSKRVNVTLQCAGTKPVTSPLPVELTVHCVPDGTAPMTVGPRRLEEQETCIRAPMTVLQNRPVELPFCPFGPSGLLPRPESVRLVELDAKDQVIGAEPVCYRGAPRPGNDDWKIDCATTLHRTPSTLGPLRFAYEAAYTDGSVARTIPSRVPVTTPELEAGKLRARDDEARRWAQEHPKRAWQSFERADQGYALEFPAGWEHGRLNQTDTESYALLDRPKSDIVDPPCGGGRFVQADVMVSVEPANGASLDALAQAHFKSASNATVRPLPFEVGGEKAVMLDLGNSMVFRDVLVVHGDRLYTFHMLAQFLPAPEALSDLEWMLKSVHFTK